VLPSGAAGGENRSPPGTPIGVNLARNENSRSQAPNPRHQPPATDH
jgi:hypothetical protein